jgi:hypothetical protein
MDGGVKKSIVAIVLGLIPLWVFVGSRSTTTINGEVVSSSALNILGVVLGLVALGIGLSTLFRATSSPLGRVLAAVAAVIGAVQLLISIGVIAQSQIGLA